jgi:hypothetical protein
MRRTDHLAFDAREGVGRGEDAAHRTIQRGKHPQAALMTLPAGQANGIGSRLFRKSCSSED